MDRLRHQSAVTRDRRGFTLVEMMTVVAIVAVMGMVAIPAFSRMIVRNDVEMAAKEIASTLQTSRLLAMNQNVTVTVTPQLLPAAGGQTLSLTVQNGNTLAPMQGGHQAKGTSLTNITDAGGGGLTPANFNPQGLLAPIGAPSIAWIISNVPQNIVYSITVSQGGRVRWCATTVVPGGTCP